MYDMFKKVPPLFLNEAAEAKMLVSVVIGPVKEGYDMSPGADLVRRKRVLTAIAFGNSFFDSPVYRLGIGGADGHIGEAAGLGGGLIKGLPNITDSGGAGTGLIAVKAAVNHPLLPRPTDGFVHVLGGGRTLAPRCTV